MKSLLTRLLYLTAGLLLFAFGIVIMIKANVGYAPWEVFHAGLAYTIGISIGVASIIAGVVIVAIVTAFGEKLGLGTILSMILTGVFIDLIMMLNIIPAAAASFAAGLIMLIIGLFVVSIGSYFYIKSAFGAGSRDNLMIVLNRKTRLPVGVCRSMVELAVTLAGWFLGGMIGIGTVFSVVIIGFCIQITFAIFKFNPASVQHETLKQTFNFIIKRVNDELLRK